MTTKLELLIALRWRLDLVYEAASKGHREVVSHNLARAKQLAVELMATGTHSPRPLMRVFEDAATMLRSPVTTTDTEVHLDGSFNMKALAEGALFPNRVSHTIIEGSRQ